MAFVKKYTFWIWFIYGVGLFLMSSSFYSYGEDKELPELVFRIAFLSGVLVSLLAYVNNKGDKAQEEQKQAVNSFHDYCIDLIDSINKSMQVKISVVNIQAIGVEHVTVENIPILLSAKQIIGSADADYIVNNRMLRIGYLWSEIDNLTEFENSFLSEKYIDVHVKRIRNLVRINFNDFVRKSIEHVDILKETKEHDNYIGLRAFCKDMGISI